MSAPDKALAVLLVAPVSQAVEPAAAESAPGSQLHPPAAREGETPE